MILAVRTDTAEAVVMLLHSGSGKVIAHKTWQANRTLARDLLKVVQETLDAANEDWSNIRGLICFIGPGSFTGLRIGAAVMNTIAHTKKVPIIGADGEDWVQKGISRLVKKENDAIVLPEYGAPARITQQKK